MTSKTKWILFIIFGIIGIFYCLSESYIPGVIIYITWSIFGFYNFKKNKNFPKLRHKNKIKKSSNYVSNEKLNISKETNVSYGRKPTEEEKRRERNKMTKKLRAEILLRDNYTCQKCGLSRYNEPNLNLHVDHIIPIAKGGKTVKENLQTLCWRCNLSKGDKIL